MAQNTGEIETGFTLRQRIPFNSSPVICGIGSYTVAFCQQRSPRPGRPICHSLHNQNVIHAAAANRTGQWKTTYVVI